MLVGMPVLDDDLESQIPNLIMAEVFSLVNRAVK